MTILNRYEIDGEVTDDASFLTDNKLTMPEKASQVMRKQPREKRMETLKGNDLVCGKC